MAEHGSDWGADSRLADADMPALYRAADATSLAGQKNCIRGTQIRLWSLLTAAAAGVFVGETGPPDWVAFLGVAAFLTAIGAEIYLLVRRPENTWYEGRAAAESAKSLAWRYAVAGEPFGAATENVDELFLGRLCDILTGLQIALDVGPDAGGQITAAMRNLRNDSLTQRRDAYCVGRIEDQRAWYQRKARWNAARAKRWRLGAIALELGGVVASILTITGTLRVDLLGIFAAASAGVVAWLQTKQHETLSRAYSITAQELAGVRSEWEGVQEEEGWAAFVDKAEEAISREHKLRRASRGVKAGW